MQRTTQPHADQLQGKRAPWTSEQIRQYLEEHYVVLFARGTKEQPRCGYTARILDWLEAARVPYDCLDVSADKSIIPALMALCGRCSFPIVAVGGKLIPAVDELGHSNDIMLAMRSAMLGDAQAEVDGQRRAVNE